MQRGVTLLLCVCLRACLGKRSLQTCLSDVEALCLSRLSRQELWELRQLVGGEFEQSPLTDLAGGGGYGSDPGSRQCLSSDRTSLLQEALAELGCGSDTVLRHQAGNDRRRMPNSLETSIECVGECCEATRNRRCRYENLYILNEELWALRLTPLVDSSKHQVLTRTRNPCLKPPCTKIGDAWHWGQPFVPKERLFSSETALEEFVASQVSMEYDGQSILSWTMTPQNIGHAIWDELFASYDLALATRLNLDQDSAWIELASSDRAKDETNVGNILFERFWGQRWHVDDLPSCVRLHHAVAGVGDSGMVTRNQNYTSQMSPEVLEPFVSRIFARHDVALPETQRCEGGTCRVALIVNKRHWANLEATSEALRSRGFESLAFDFAKMGGVSEQLAFLRTTDIVASSVGTAMTAVPFLGRGSVVINVGWHDGFWDEYLVASVPWLRTIYPDTLTPTGWRSTDELIHLVERARRSIQQLDPIGPHLSRMGAATANVLQRSRSTWHHVNFISTKICFEYGVHFAFNILCGRLSCAPLNSTEYWLVYDARQRFKIGAYCKQWHGDL